VFWDIAGHFSWQFHFTHWVSQAVPSVSQISYLPTCKALRFLCDLSASALNPKTEIEPRISRMDTDYERVMEMIFKPVWCILKSVKIRAI
jgi:hypothetical protein